MTVQLREKEVREELEARPGIERQVRRFPRRGLLVFLAALLAVGTTAVFLSITLGRDESVPAWQGWGLEEPELDMIAARLAPRAPIASTAGRWDLSPDELSFITGRSAPIVPSPGRWDLSPEEMGFITGRSAPIVPSPGRWDLEPEEMEFLSR